MRLLWTPGEPPDLGAAEAGCSEGTLLTQEGESGDPLSGEPLMRGSEVLAEEVDTFRVR